MYVTSKEFFVHGQNNNKQKHGKTFSSGPEHRVFACYYFVRTIAKTPHQDSNRKTARPNHVV